MTWVRKVNWDKNKELGKVSDVALAAKYGLHRSSVLKARIARGIPPCLAKGYAATRKPRKERLRGEKAVCKACGTPTTKNLATIPRKLGENRWAFRARGRQHEYKTREEAIKKALLRGMFCEDCSTPVCDCGQIKIPRGFGCYETACMSCLGEPVSNTARQVLSELRVMGGQSISDMSSLLEIPRRHTQTALLELTAKGLTTRTEIENDMDGGQGGSLIAFYSLR
jgi:hypothetical protein